MRKQTIDPMESTMVNFTSLAARSALGMESASGQSSMAKPSWMKISCVASSRDAGESVYRFKISGSAASSTTFTATIMAYSILSSLRV